MPRIAMAMAFAVLSLVACAGDDGLSAWTEMKSEVAMAAGDFLKAFAKPEEVEKWRTALKEKMESRTLEDVALDWFFDNQGQLRSKDRGAFKVACMFLVEFVRTGTPPPARVRDRLTTDNLRDLVEFLKDEVRSP